MKLDKTKIKTVAIPFLALVGILALYLLGGKLILAKIRESEANFKEAQRENNVLSEKVAVLESFQGQAGGVVDAAVVAFPAKNSSLAAAVQLKRQAQEMGVTLVNLKIGSEAGDKGVSAAQLSFDIDGPRELVIRFIREIEKLAPVSRLVKVKLGESSGGARAAVTLTVFWAPFPERLPELSEPLVALSSEDLEMARTLSALKRPLFVELAPATTASPRENPFSL